MEDEVFYIANDARCLSAMEDLEAGMDTLNWLGQYLELYMSITYGPKDNSRIANCNYQGKQYDAILDFVTLYIKTHHEYEDPFSGPSEGSED